MVAEGRSPPRGVSLSFPPFSSSKLACVYNKSIELGSNSICVASLPPGRIIFTNDYEVVSVRYQYKKKVALWKKGSPFAASFSTSFTLNFNRDAERSVKRLFGGGIAFAITPTIDVGSSGPESFGLFPIDQSNGRPLMPSDPRTVAVEIDTSRDTTYGWDPQIPHVGIDINSVDSVKSRFLWNGTRFIDRKIAVFIDYDASSQEISVRFQNVSANGSPDKRKSKLFLSYSGLDLSKLVNERSYVGFSMREPVVDNGAYVLYDWKFSTKWVLRKKD
jgi:hypothetical protein